MKTKFAFLALAIALLLATGCSGAQNPPPNPVAQPTSTVSVIPDSISFSLNPSLGSDYEIKVIAESSGADLGYADIHPKYTELTIKGYPLAGSTLTPRIYQFSVQRFNEMLPDLLPARLADLQALISGGTSSSEDLPLLPLFNSAQMFYSQYAVIEFQNGKGIRYITQYSQGIVPINNQEMFYTFQGLTADNEYWISVILPISHSTLPADGQNPPDGQSMEDFARDYLAYKSDTAAQLNAQSAESFVPSITLLDALVNSIVIQP